MKGRVAIYEVMPISETIRDMILEDASTAVLREQAQKEGMKTLRQAGMAKVLEGRDDRGRGRARDARMRRAV